MAILSLKSLLSIANAVLDADLPTLAGALLRRLKSEGVTPGYQRAGLNCDYVLAVMERRNVGLGPLLMVSLDMEQISPPLLKHL